MEAKTISQRWTELYSKQSEHRRRAEQYAYYTIPSLYPRDESRADTDSSVTAIGMSDPVGARAVNHLSNKLVKTLFSPNRPFFRLKPNEQSPEIQKVRQFEKSQNAAEQQQAKAIMAQLDGALAVHEREAMKYLEQAGNRTTATLAAKLLVVTGDCLITMYDNAKVMVYSTRDYVAVKDLAGKTVELIYRESKAFGTFNTATQDAIRNARVGKNADELMADTPVTLYTRFVITDEGRYHLTQAAEDVDLEDKGIKYPEADMPVVHLSWNLITGENYGRGLVEDYAGGFHMIDQLTEALMNGATLMSDIKYLVDPASMLDVEELNAAETGTYHTGRKDDVSVIETLKGNDFQFIDAVVERLKREIAQAFLMMSGATRDAERVTAEEVRELAQELEVSHGGVYSRFANDWQKPAARLALKYIGVEMGDQVEPQIITGLDSLSRDGELQNIRMWANDLAMLNAIPEDVRARIKLGPFLNYLAKQRGIEHAEFVMTDTEFKELMQQRQQEAMDQQAAIMDREADAEAQKEMAKRV